MAKCISIIDMENLKMNSIIYGGDTLDFVKKMVGIANLHYPERSLVMFVINAPSWFSMLWKMIKPMIHPNTQKKIKILSKSEVLTGLLEFIDISQIPIYYGGQMDYDNGRDKDSCRWKSPDELALVEFVNNIGKPAPAGSTAQFDGQGGTSSRVISPNSDGGMTASRNSSTTLTVENVRVLKPNSTPSRTLPPDTPVSDTTSVTSGKHNICLVAKYINMSKRNYTSMLLMN